MNEIPAEVANLLPAKYMVYLNTALILGAILGRAVQALRSGGGLVSIWRGILFGTNSTTPKQEANKDGSGVVSLLLVGALLCSPVVLMQGCTSSAARVTYQTAGATSVTVEAAVRAYNVFAAQGKTTVEQNLAVKKAYERYQACMAVLCDAGMVYAASAGNTNAPAAAGLQQAALNASASIADVVNLVRALGVEI